VGVLGPSEDNGFTIHILKPRTEKKQSEDFFLQDDWERMEEVFNETI
jgi:hypothetical protein